MRWAWLPGLRASLDARYEMLKEVKVVKNPSSATIKQKALRVLLIEDSEDDALLIIRELKKGGYNPEYRRVETAAAMKKAIKDDQWDIILCDYSLPKFNAPQAIRLLRELNTDIPVIIVSGAIGEETAADCMILGARDFIRKSNLSRLCPAVARELQEARTRCTQKLAQKALRESENFLASVFESIQDGISILDTKLNIIGVNETHKKWYMHKAPLVGRKCYDAYHDRSEPCTICPSRQTLRTGRPSSLIVPKEDNNQVSGWLEIYSFPLKDEAAGEIRGVIEYVRDITERKSIEDALEKQKKFTQTIVEESPAYFVAIGADGKTIMMNQALLKALGYTKKEVTGKNYLQTFVPKAEHEALAKVFNSLVRQKKSTLNENHVLTKSGEEILVEWHGRPVFKENGELDYFFGVGININQRHKAQEELRQSEEKYRSILSSIQEGYFEVDLSGTYTFVNDANCRLLGYTKDELIGMNYRQHMDGATAKKLRKPYIDLYRTGKPIKSLEVDSYKKDGTKVTYETSVSLIKDAQGKPIGFRGVSRDITARKQAEAALKHSEEKYRNILEGIEEGYYETDLHGNLTFFNDAACHISGYSPEESLGMNFRQYTPESDADKVYSIFHEVYKTGIPVKGLSYEIIRKNKTIRYVETSISLRKDSAGKIIGFQGIVRDITERKLAEEKLRESEENYRNLFNNAKEGILIAQDDRISFANPALVKILGYPIDVIRSKPFTSFIHPEDSKKVLERHQRRLRGEEVETDYSFRIISGDGTKKWVQIKSQIISWYGIPSSLSFIEDITAQKKAQKELAVSEEKYRSILENMQEGYYEVDLDGNTTFANDAMCRIQGFSREEIIGMNNRQYTDPETAKRVYQEFNEVYNTEKPGKTSEHEIIRKDGSKIWIEASIALRKDRSGNKIGFKGIVRDITERKKAEEELRKKHKELETMIEASPIMIYFKDTQNKFIRVNRALLEATGLAREEIEGKSNEEVNPKQAAHYLQEDKEIIATGKPKIGTYEEIKTRKGRKVLLTDKVPYRDKEGNIIGVIGFSVDITAQKKAQDALRESEEKYRKLVENAQEGVYQSTADGKYLTMNPAFARILGYDSVEELMQSVEDISRQLYVQPQDRQRLLKLVEKYGSVADFETEFYRKNKTRVWLSVSMHAVRDARGEILYYQGMAQDISEKKKMDAERKENLQKLRKALGATINAMAVTVETRDPYTAGHQRRVADLARAIATEMKLSSDKIDAVRMASVIHDIGKISIPSEILTKPTQLSDLEYNLIKTHPSSGHAILKDIEFPWPIARIVLEHHERIDGSGYPCGLKGDEILLESRIVAVADVVEAISSHRPYRAAQGIEAGLEEIEKNKGRLYDAQAVDACLRLFREKHYKMDI
ncbi:MAG TPA: PAS domain S-box protein [Smithellaceae bacterium]|nr:PAS domain S-box protein [Smithellaceae bacterium]HRS89060.1 PAS domain S-box protein [Smithellaceae bacterium]HRV25068.1 PAS domain S-box protein [Smithellaceae bacterium]